MFRHSSCCARGGVQLHGAHLLCVTNRRSNIVIHRDTQAASWPGWQVAVPAVRALRLRAPALATTPTATQDANNHTGSAGSNRDMSSSLSLTNIRNTLIRLEDTIIFNFIERAQFSKNDAVYTPGAVPVPAYNKAGRQYSLLEYVLRETEQLHGSVRRYTSPDEHAFYPGELPVLVLPPLDYASELASCAQHININSTIMRCYLQDILPGITRPDDDNNYGSAATLDVLCLQALSKRIHYGKFVAEAKFRSATEQYTELIRAQDGEAIMELLTDRAVEQKVAERVRRKAATFGQEITEATDISSVNLEAPTSGTSHPQYKVSPDMMARVYVDLIMPLTKEVEVLYLLARLQD